jgi:hypothetical protein
MEFIDEQPHQPVASKRHCAARQRNPELVAIGQRRSYALKAKNKYQVYCDYLKTLPGKAPHNMYRTNEAEISRVQRRLERLESVLDECSKRVAEITQAAAGLAPPEPSQPCQACVV